MSEQRPHKWRHRAGLVIGVALLVAAAYVASRQVDLHAMVEAGPLPALAIALLVAANLLVTATLFHLITRGFDADPPVPFSSMLALICSSALLNYMPFRAGLIGRAAWLKAVHRLPVTQSVAILLVALVLGGVVLSATALTLLLAPPGWRWPAVGAVVLALSATAGQAARRSLKREVVAPWAWPILRLIDLLAASGRLWLAFQVIGRPVGFDDAVLASTAGLLVNMVGLTPNGLGLREWLIALLTEALTPTSGSAGLAAAVLDRGVEALVTTVAGLIAIPPLRQAMTAAAGTGATPE